MMENPFADLIPGATTTTGRIYGNPKQPPVQTGAQAAQDALNVERTEVGLENDRSKPTYDRFGALDKLRSEVRQDKRILAYEQSLPIWTSALKAPPTPEGDMLLVNAFAKVNDPLTGVQAGEGAAIAGAGSTVEQWRARLGKEFGTDEGGNFTPEARARLKSAVTTRMRELAGSYNAARGELRSYIQSAGVPDVDPDVVLGPHMGAQFQQAEADFLGRPVRNLDGSQGAEPTLPRTPEELDADLKSMIAARAPAAAIRARLAEVGSQLPPEQDAILDAYEQARLAGQDVQLGVQTQPEASTGLGIVKGAFRPLDRAAEGLENAVNWALGTDFSSAADANREREEFFRQNPTTVGGEAIGGAGASLVGGALFKSPVVAGAISSILGGDSRTVGGVITEGVSGALGGKLADKAIKTVANVVAPALSGNVRKLASEGVEMTPGQIVGGKLKAVEDRATSYPIVQDRVLAGREAAAASFNKATYARALKPLGAKVPKDLPAGHDGVKFVEAKLRDAYQRVLPRIQANLDPTFVTRAKTLRLSARLPEKQLSEFDEILQREVAEAFDPVTGRIDGREFKLLDERLGDLAKSYKSSDDPYTRKLGGAVGGLRDQIGAMIRRQNPKEAHTLRGIDLGWAQFARIRDAASKSSDGIFSPKQLGAAVRAGDRSVGKGATARGDALLQDLSKAGSDVLPSDIGNSGTADRIGLGRFSDWLIGAGLAPLYRPGSQEAFRALALTPRSPAAEVVADTLRQLPAGAAGGVGAGMLLAPPGN